MDISAIGSDLNSEILLLKSQGLKFTSQTFFDDYNELCSSNSLMVQISKHQTSEDPSCSCLPYQTWVENGHFFCSLNDKSKPKVLKNDFELTQYMNNQFDMMKVVSENLGIQIKVYTSFMGKLTSRKIGKKGWKKLFLFMNQQNQFALLTKTALTPKGNEPLENPLLKQNSANKLQLSQKPFSKLPTTNSDHKHGDQASKTPGNFKNINFGLNDFEQKTSNALKVDEEEKSSLSYSSYTGNQKVNKDILGVNFNWIFKMNDLELKILAEKSLFGLEIET